MSKTAHLAITDDPSPVSQGCGTTSSSTGVCQSGRHRSVNIVEFVVFENHYDDSSSEDDKAASMAYKSPKPLKKRGEQHDFDAEEPRTMEWIFPEPMTMCPGGDQVFTAGSLKGKTFIDVTLKHPQQFLACKKFKSLIVEMRSYVNWAENYYDIDSDTKEVKLKGSPAHRQSLDGCTGDCEHRDVHHKGSSAKYQRSTCKACGHVWKVEKHSPYHFEKLESNCRQFLNNKSRF